jgi:hypothetical protein
MTVLTVNAFTKAFIGPAKAFLGTDFTLTDFTTGSPVWAEIKGLTDLGAVGDSAELISSNQLGVGRTRKAKGVRNAGSMAIICDQDLTDSGQLALVAAEKTRNSYMFKIELDDEPSGGTPSLRYFVAFVMSATEGFNDASQTVKLNATLEVDSNIVRVAADDGA